MYLARLATILLTLMLSLLTLVSAQTNSSSFTYPQPRRGDQVDDYHGTKIADPYRCLEDTDSAETHPWAEPENKVTLRYLDQTPHPPPIRHPLPNHQTHKH